MIQMKFLTLIILVIFICQIIIDFILGSARLETLGYWPKKFLTEARKKELEAKQSEKRKVKIAPKLWALAREPIIIFLPLLFIIDGLILKMEIILYNPYLSFFNPIDIYLQIIGLIIIFFGFILYLISGKTILKHVYSKATEERKMMTTGLYAYIRHPLYLSIFLIPLGFLLITLNYLSLFYFIAFTVGTGPDEECGRERKFAFITKEARCDEKGLKKIYGKDYEEYMEKTGRFLPKFRKKKYLKYKTDLLP